MESDESRHCSSSSNSLTNSFDNLQQSFSNQTNLEIPNSTEGRCSRNCSQSSNEYTHSVRSQFNNYSESSSSSISISDVENNGSKSSFCKNRFQTDSIEANNSDLSLAKTVSPVKLQQSSINSKNPLNRIRSNSCEIQNVESDMNISHEDLSDVSDMENDKRDSSSNNSKHSTQNANRTSTVHLENIEDDFKLAHKKHNYMNMDDKVEEISITDLRQKLDKKKTQLQDSGINSNIDKNKSSGININESLEDFVKTHDEDALDFEAEEGECQEINKDDKRNSESYKEQKILMKFDGDGSDMDELEEGEVSDEDEKRPEETEPKPICRFYTRGQCTWGMSCRFLHPGVTDKGNYTMFDLVRTVPLSQSSVVGTRGSNFNAHATDFPDYRSERPLLHSRTSLHHVPQIFPNHSDPRTLIPDSPVVVESAWERGLRTAKEMMRKANKRKEQDMDFEDKKMNLTLSPDELEKEPYYIKEKGSPVEIMTGFGRHGIYQEASGSIYNSPDRFGRCPPVSSFDDVDPYGRTTRYRELPPHRMPQYEDERRVRPTREVIVQRVEPSGRGDEWNDPWMRSKSPGGHGSSRDRIEKRRRDQTSYSTNSSYSSSTSSQSDSSSDSSRLPSSPEQRHRYNNVQKSPISIRRHGVRTVRSPSIIRRSRLSPNLRSSPKSKRHYRILSPQIANKKISYSPIHKRKKTPPIFRKLVNSKSKVKRRNTTTSSGSGSSDSSISDSDSETGSSSSNSSRSIGHTASKILCAPQKFMTEKKIVKKESLKKRSPISIEIKKQATVGASALISPTRSVSSEKDNKKSRREELLKQLRAVEDAIAKKRSKLS